MSKKILLAVLMLGLIAMPAFAAVQNVKVSGDINSIWLYRHNFDLGASLIEDDSQNLFITQAWLQVDADLTDQVSATVRLLNERPWDSDVDADDPDDSDIDLNLAYVTLRDVFDSPLSLVVGRQAWAYGNSFIFDSSGANNVAPADSGIANVAADLTAQKALDAVRAIFDYDPLAVELFWAKVDSGAVTSTQPGEDDDIDLYGVDATYSLGDAWDTLVEGYFFARLDKSTSDAGTAGPNTGNNNGYKTDSTYVPGIRVSTNPIEGLNVQGEVAWQGGNKVLTTSQSIAGIHRNVRRKALGAQLIANYQVPLLEEYNPALQYVYTYVSGDKNADNGPGGYNDASDEEYTAWDPFFEAQGGGTVYNTIFDLSNAHIHGVTFSAEPISDLTTKVTWWGIWLDKGDQDGLLALRQPDGTSATANITTNKDDYAGYEIDFDAAYAYTEDVSIGASLGWFVPGDLFDDVVAETSPTRSKTSEIASQILVNVDVAF